MNQIKSNRFVSESFFGPVHWPRFLLHGLGWTILCLSLQDVVPFGWAWGALPTALATAYFTGRVVRTPLLQIAIIAVLPWIMRLALVNFDAVVIYDNGWLLTAPYWYFTALMLHAVYRRPSAGYAEALVLAGFTAVLLSRSGTWGRGLSPPALETVRLFLSVAVLILTVLSFAAIRIRVQRRWAGHTKIQDSPPPVSRAAAGLIFIAVLVLLIFWGNRFRKEQTLISGGGVLSGDLFRFDFSDVLNLEPKISLSSELTMLYREDNVHVPRYLRRLTLSGWNAEKGFFVDAKMETDRPGSKPRPASLPRSSQTWPPGGTEGRESVYQEYYLAALDPESFFALDSPVSVTPWIIWDDASFSRAYGVTSSVSSASRRTLIQASSEPSVPPASSVMSEEIRSYYLQSGDDPYYQSLSEQILKPGMSGWEKAHTVEQWFKSNFYYSLNPGLAPDGNQLSWFLKSSRRGYCSYFAFAMTQILRTAGVPARVAVGFRTDPQTSVLGFTPVRADQAHAWVEVWIDRYGWITFDPTSDTLAPGEDYPVQFISADKWLPLVEEVLSRRGDVRAAAETPDDLIEQLHPETWWKELFSRTRNNPFAVLLLLFLLTCAVYAPGRIVPALSLWIRLRSAGPAAAMRKRWVRAARKFSRCGLEPTERETPLVWAVRLENEGLKRFRAWTELYLKAVFAEHFDRLDADRSSKEETSVQTAWKKQAFSRRLFAALSPAWRQKCPW